MEFEKRCRYCGKTFLGKGEAPYGICPDCEQEKYCDRCCQEISYHEYMGNGGLCDECADIMYNGEQDD